MEKLLETNDQHRWQRYEVVQSILIINITATLIAVLMQYGFSNPSSPFFNSRLFIYPLIYLNILGIIIALCFPKVMRYATQLQHPYPVMGAVVITALVLLIFVGCLLSRLMLFALGYDQPERLEPRFLFGLRISLIVTLTFGITLYFYLGTKQMLHTKELNEERALKFAAEARHAMLAARIHPHFLFNTLNSISALIQDDPPLAERTVERFAALLRFSLDSANERLIFLDQEMKIVIDYLEIEKVRYGPRLNYTLDIPQECGSLLVPPLSIQTLVENSVKYAIAPSSEQGAIAIVVRVESRQISVEVCDSGPGFTTEMIKPGHGIDNLQSRLSTLYGRGAKLEIAGNSTGGTVSLTLPQGEISQYAQQ